ncbi:MAG: hypothetical protein ABEJ06_04385 [Haloarculaceae archaeon]
MNDSTRRLLAGVFGVIVAAIAGSAVGATITTAYGLPQAYAQGISMAFIAPAVMLTSLARRDFRREAYYRDRGREGLLYDAALTGAVALLGGVAGAAVVVTLGVGETLSALGPFVVGMLAGAAVFIARNRAYYERSPF